MEKQGWCRKVLLFVGALHAVCTARLGLFQLPDTALQASTVTKYTLPHNVLFEHCTKNKLAATLQRLHNAHPVTHAQLL